MKLLVISLGGLFTLFLLFYVIHLVAITRLTKTSKRHNVGQNECIRRRQQAKQRNSILGILLVISAAILISLSYYTLFTEGVKGATVNFEQKNSKAKVKTVPTTTSQSTVAKESSSVKKSKETTKKVETDKTKSSNNAIEKEKKEKEAQELKAEEDKKKAEEEQKQDSREEEEGDGQPIQIDGEFETDVQGLATVTGKAKKGIKRISVTNSINNEEQQIDVDGDGTFSFNYTMSNAMEMIILYICDSSQTGSIPQEERQTTLISASFEFMQAYQEKINAENEEGYGD